MSTINRKAKRIKELIKEPESQVRDSIINCLLDDIIFESA